jgi:hypothetical protein
MCRMRDLHHRGKRFIMESPCRVVVNGLEVEFGSTAKLQIGLINALFALWASRGLSLQIRAL